MKISNMPPGPAFIQDILFGVDFDKRTDEINKYIEMGYKYQPSTCHSPAGYVRPNGALDKINE